MNVRHFVSPTGTMYRITSETELTPAELDAVLERVQSMDQSEIAIEGQVTLAITAAPSG